MVTGRGYDVRRTTEPESFIKSNNYAPTDERSFIWWINDQQQWEERARATADALDGLF
ncbi:hypothetical protein MXM41_19095 [Leclercia adecarboxylata]|uniref:hypothetical protein n=1 Tax=Leclercia adecarboxylata TaxID=83655 RepID=UPI002DBA6C9F|nr:hypothetical protein [Leclercia adecarboxylata]MEB6381010.1 hypothetical protein [Leclercia adecarboxylata]